MDEELGNLIEKANSANIDYCIAFSNYFSAVKNNDGNVEYLYDEYKKLFKVSDDCQNEALKYMKH
jgi:L-arabinose isomerase